MKVKYVFLLVLLTGISCKSLRYSQRNVNSELFTVEKIVKRKDLYIIEANRNDSIFVVISTLGNTGKANNRQIKKNHQYDLALKKIYPSDNLVSYAEASFFEIGKARVRLNQRNRWSVYVATNLNGLYIDSDLPHCR